MLLRMLLLLYILFRLEDSQHKLKPITAIIHKDKQK